LVKVGSVGKDRVDIVKVRKNWQEEVKEIKRYC